jgi:hypothetical protein
MRRRNILTGWIPAATSTANVRAQTPTSHGLSRLLSPSARAIPLGRKARIKLNFLPEIDLSRTAAGPRMSLSCHPPFAFAQL